MDQRIVDKIIGVGTAYNIRIYKSGNSRSNLIISDNTTDPQIRFDYSKDPIYNTTTNSGKNLTQGIRFQSAYLTFSIQELMNLATPSSHISLVEVTDLLNELEKVAHVRNNLYLTHGEDFHGFYTQTVRDKRQNYITLHGRCEGLFRLVYFLSTGRYKNSL